MKYLSGFFFCAFAVSLSVPGQTDSAIREIIVPLHSTRSDVEKIAKPIKDYVAWYEYETESGNIVVFYARKKCIGHGWNVEPDVVTGYRFYPKEPRKFEEISEKFSQWFRTSDDILSSIYTNNSDGIIYVFDQFNLLRYITYLPTEKDSDLRCSGFPKFSPLPYSPADSYTVNPISGWGIGNLHPFISMTNKSPALTGYIFIYAERGKKSEVEELQKKIENMAYIILKVDRKKVVIMFGGFRDETEIETYSIPSAYPPPVPKPTYGNG